MKRRDKKDKCKRDRRINSMDTGEGVSLLRNDHKHIFTSLEKSFLVADEIHVCVAFLKQSGLQQLEKSITNAAKRGCRMYFYIGTDFYQTEPTTLWFLLKLSNQSKNIKFYLLTQDTSTFHPKLYLTLTKGAATVFVGSSNMTQGGLSDNIEAMVRVDMSEEHEFIRATLNFLDYIAQNKRADIADPVSISNYERRYDTFKLKIKKAEKEAKKEIASLFELNSALLKKYLKDYLNNEEEQTNWSKRVKDYKTAKQILDGINRQSIKTKTDFLDAYEKLVGKSGQRGLWHSGSIFRMKNKVAPHYGRFITMLEELRNNIGKEPGEMFELAKSHFDNIHGLGGNVVTEILNTYIPQKYPILNKNPLSSLKNLGLSIYPNQQSFHPETYAQYSNLMSEIAKMCDFESLGRVDHFMNFIYWKYVKE